MNQQLKALFNEVDAFDEAFTAYDNSDGDNVNPPDLDALLEAAKAAESACEADDKRLKQASRGLGDILGMCADLSARYAQPEVSAVLETIARRVLCSADRVRECPKRPPDWMRRLFADYESGRLNAAGTSRPARNLAAELAQGELPCASR